MSGWNLPPGCSVADIDRAAGAHMDRFYEQAERELKRDGLDCGHPAPDEPDDRGWFRCTVAACPGSVTLARRAEELAEAASEGPDPDAAYERERDDGPREYHDPDEVD